MMSAGLDQEQASALQLEDRIVERAREHGTLRADFQGTDLPMIQLSLTTLMDVTRTFEPSLYRRYLAMFLDGMRGDRGPLSELPVEALSVEEAGRAFARRS